MQRAIFLDRDGVLNRTNIKNGKPYAPTKFEDFEILPGTYKALTSLKNIGFELVVITNQPDVGNGKVKKDVVEKMNAYLGANLPINMIKVCYHSQTDGCTCRKPKPGMIINAATELKLSLSQSYMIGDRSVDVSAGKAAGCTSILINKNYNEQLVDEPDYRVNSLAAAVNLIISQNMEK